MQAGKLDTLIDIQSVTESNVGGEVTETLGTAIPVWAYILSQKGSEAFEAARLNATDNIRVCIRYRDDVNVKWRITWAGQSYNITNVDRSDRRLGVLWLMAQALGAV